ncbi:MAG TPA: type II toxin-antitoxin system VapC family toxin [Longimicrobiales bacterium]|nr:type II toxin-antitoxin system VapC family toxin [Longimicrobiales bacterium]
MGEALILETTFLVDLEREALAAAPGRAHAFLEAYGDRALCITLTTAGELACGPRVEEQEAWRRLVTRFKVLTPDLDASWSYGQTYRYLADNGLLIGANDLWIAAVALVHGLPLVTRAEAHFRRVPGLRVLGY